jgi:hypothetical protein
MKTKLTLFVTVLAAALFGVGCGSLGKGLVAYYPFNGDARDKSWNWNHGEVKGATLAEDRDGKADSAYSFDGVDDHIYVASSHDLKEMESVSVSLWMKVNGKQNPAENGYNSIVARWGKGGHSFWIGTGAGGANITVSMNPHLGGAPLVGNFNRHDWLHVVYAHDSMGEAALFFNGERVVHKDLKMELKTFDEPLIFGADGHGSKAFFKGSLDDVRIWNRALSAEEVKALYNLEKPKGK